MQVIKVTFVYVKNKIVKETKICTRYVVYDDFIWFISDVSDNFNPSVFRFLYLFPQHLCV